MLVSGRAVGVGDTISPERPIFFQQRPGVPMITGALWWRRQNVAAIYPKGTGLYCRPYTSLDPSFGSMALSVGSGA